MFRRGSISLALTLFVACAPQIDLPTRSSDASSQPIAPDAELAIDVADAGFADLGFADTGTHADAAIDDLGFADASTIALDAGIADAPAPDVIEPDAEILDAPAPDALVFPDADPIDTGAPDAGDPDSGVLDADPPDVPSTDIGPLLPGVSTLTGSEQSGDADGPRGIAAFDNPVNVTTATGGLAYVADFYNSRVVSVTADGTATTVYRSPVFIRPFGLAVSSTTTLYVQTDRNATGADGGALWRIDLRTLTATVVANNIGRPRALAILNDGRIAFADYTTHVVGVFDPLTRTSTTIAGSPGIAGFADGTGSAALFDTPSDIVVTSSITLLVADRNNNRLRSVTLSGMVTTYSGDGTASSVDGPIAVAQFNSPLSLARDSLGNLYVADAGSYLIRRITSSGQVSTYAGDGTAGFLDAAMPLQARFFGMEGIDVTQDDAYLLVADGTRGLFAPYHRIRRVELLPP